MVLGLSTYYLVAREERTRGVTLADVHGFDAEDPLCSTLTATLQSFAAVTLLHAKLRGIRSAKFHVILYNVYVLYTYMHAFDSLPVLFQQRLFAYLLLIYLISILYPSSTPIAPPAFPCTFVL